MSSCSYNIFNRNNNLDHFTWWPYFPLSRENRSNFGWETIILVVRVSERGRGRWRWREGSDKKKETLLYKWSRNKTEIMEEEEYDDFNFTWEMRYNSLLHQIKHWQSIRINYKYCTLERRERREQNSGQYFTLTDLIFLFLFPHVCS